MPRRPLFCRVCTELLDELTAAAEAVVAGSNFAGSRGTNESPAALQAGTEARNRYFELRGRVDQHREAAHAGGSQIRFASRCRPEHAEIARDASLRATRAR